MALTDWMFDVEPAVHRADGWWVAVEGARRWEWGPFEDAARARAVCHRVFQRWRRAASDHGGWAWMSTPRRWIITVPGGCEVQGRPFHREACTRHTA